MVCNANCQDTWLRQKLFLLMLRNVLLAWLSFMSRLKGFIHTFFTTWWVERVRRFHTWFNLKKQERMEDLITVWLVFSVSRFLKEIWWRYQRIRKTISHLLFESASVQLKRFYLLVSNANHFSRWISHASITFYCSDLTAMSSWSFIWGKNEAMFARDWLFHIHNSKKIFLWNFSISSNFG